MEAVEERHDGVHRVHRRQTPNQTTALALRLSTATLHRYDLYGPVADMWGGGSRGMFCLGGGNENLYPPDGH